MDKKCNWIVGLYTLIFGLTFGLECLIFKHKMVSFWIGEVFFALSTGGVILSFILLEKKPCEKVSGISAVLFSNIYFGLEILLSVIFAIIPFNAKWGIVIEIVPLALYCVIIYSTLVTGKFISNQDSSVDQKMKFLQLLEHNLKYARANCTDDKVCERLNVLIDKVHYTLLSIVYGNPYPQVLFSYGPDDYHNRVSYTNFLSVPCQMPFLFAFPRFIFKVVD